MNLSHPAFDLFGENEGRILQRLAVLAEVTSGRRIHELSGVKSLRTTQQILSRLVAIGLVSLRLTGASNLYSLNRGHILWHPISQVLESPGKAETYITETLNQVIGGRMAGAVLYGSFARGDAGRDSDIDILVVWAEPIDTATGAELLDEASERIRRITGNTAQMLPMTKDEVSALVAGDDPLIESLRADARSLTEGFDLKKLLVSSR